MESISRKPYEGFMGTTQAKVLGLVLAFALAFVLLYFGAYANYCLFVLIGVAMFVIPKIFGVKGFKVLLAFGVIFFLFTSLVGALFVTVPVIESMEDVEITGDFSGYGVTETDAGYVFSISYAGTETPQLHYIKVDKYNTSFALLVGQDKYVDMASNGDGRYSAELDLDYDMVYLVYFSAGDSTSAKKVVSETLGPNTVRTTSITGNMYVTAIPVVMFIIILGSSTWMRRNFEKQRAKLEKEGRLYPKGYGLCKKCGRTILPGEKVCRTCGTPVDVPEEIQRETLTKLYGVTKCPECGADVIKIERVCPSCKHLMPGFSEGDDYFECSACGAAVPPDSKQCPQCGELFEDDEQVEGGSPEPAVDERGVPDDDADAVIVCQGCGYRNSGRAKFCSKCGKDFRKG